MTTPEVAVKTLWFIWWVSWLLAAAWSDRAVKRPPRRSQIIYRLLAAVGAILLFGLYQHDVAVERILWSTPDGLAWVMVAVTSAGLLFTWWARIHLGRLWSSSVGRKADHRIVGTGPVQASCGIRSIRESRLRRSRPRRSAAPLRHGSEWE